MVRLFLDSRDFLSFRNYPYDAGRRGLGNNAHFTRACATCFPLYRCICYIYVCVCVFLCVCIVFYTCGVRHVGEERSNCVIEL